MPYQHVPSPPMDEELLADCQHAFHLRMPDGTMFRSGFAAMVVLEETARFTWFYRLCRYPPLIWCVELGYWLVARFRGKLYKYVLRRFDSLRDLPMSEPF